MEKPLVSLCIYTYKQENFVRETLEAAVAQDYPNLEIIVSDDCSPDNTFGVIQNFANNYKGPHKLIINRNNPNLGIAGNVMKLFSLSHGKYIVNNCGDDLSLPNRVSVSVEAIIKAGVESMSFAMIPFGQPVTKSGVFDDFDQNSVIRYHLNDYIKGGVLSSGASRIMTRKIVEFFGPLNPDCPTEDSTFTFRAFLLGGIAYSKVPVVKYRIHEENTSIGVNYLKRINPYPIYKEYIKDLDIARTKGLVSESEEDSLEKKFDIYLERESLVRELFFSRNNFRRGIKLIGILLSFKVHTSTKKMLTKKYLSWVKHNI